MSQTNNEIVSGTHGLQQKGVDWYKKNDLYIRYFYLSSLPPEIPPFLVNLVMNVPGIQEAEVKISPDDNDRHGQTGKLAAIKSMASQVLNSDNIYKLFRNKTIRKMADDTTKTNKRKTRLVAVFFKLVVKKKDHLETCTEIVEQLGDEIGVEIEPIQAPPQECEKIYSIRDSEMHILNPEYCLNLAATAELGMIFVEPYSELIADAYDINLTQDPD